MTVRGEDNSDTGAEPENYRPNVGIMLVNQAHQLLAGDAFHYPGEWMMPQGGIDPSETPQQAMVRELQEETGLLLADVRLLHEHKSWLNYRFRKPQYKDDIFYVGQRQKWFLLEYNGDLPDAEAVREREFIRFDWVDPDWLVAQIPEVKKAVYTEVLAAFRPFFP